MENRKFDNNLKYQGWEQMSDILDREMPKKKRRKGLILFFTLLLLFVFSFLVNGVMTSNNKKTIHNDKTMRIVEDSSIVKKKIDQKSKIKNKVNRKGKDKKIPDATDENLIIINKVNHSINISPKPKKKPKLNSNLFADSNTPDKLYPLYNVPDKKQRNMILASIKKIEITEIIGAKNKNVGLDIFKVKSITAKKRKNRISFINPFLGAKTYAVTTDKVNLKLGLEIGNRFSYNRHFTDISINYHQSEIIIPQVLLFNDYLYNSNLDNSIESIGHTSQLYPDLASGFFGLNIAQGYWISKRLNFELGIGIAYTKSKVNKSLGENEKLKNNFNISLDKYTISSHFDIAYQVANRLSVIIGYKHYFNSNYNLYYDKNKIYRIKVVNKSKIKGLNFGVRIWL